MKLIKSFWRKRFFETRWRSRTLRTVDKGYIKEKWDKKFSSIKTKEGYRKNGIHLTNLLRELRVLQSLIKLSHFIYFLYPSKNILPSFTQNFYSVYVVLLWRLCMQGMRTIKRTYLSLFSLGTARVQQFQNQPTYISIPRYECRKTLELALIDSNATTKVFLLKKFGGYGTEREFWSIFLPIYVNELCSVLESRLVHFRVRVYVSRQDLSLRADKKLFTQLPLFWRDWVWNKVVVGIRTATELLYQAEVAGWVFALSSILPKHSFGFYSSFYLLSFGSLTFFLSLILVNDSEEFFMIREKSINEILHRDTSP